MERATAERIKQARLPCKKEFKHFDCDFQKGISLQQLDILEKQVFTLWCIFRFFAALVEEKHSFSRAK